MAGGWGEGVQEQLFMLFYLEPQLTG
jgi:hypothetical protein